jgi:hypothetical protein
MQTDQFIYSEEFIRGRIYSYLRFQKYMTKIAEIVCKELDMDEKIISVSLNPSGDTVFVRFEESEFGFDSSFLWDKNLKGTIEKYLDQ